MKVKAWAEFTADLPDDQIEDDSEIVQFGGKSVAEAISEILKGLGCTVDPPRYADEHGWELDIKAGKRRLWCQVTLIDKYLIVVEDLSLFSKMLGRYHPTYLDVLTRLSRELAGDPRFHDVLWYSSNQVMSGVPGAKEPVDA